MHSSIPEKGNAQSALQQKDVRSRATCDIYMKYIYVCAAAVKRRTMRRVHSRTRVCIQERRGRTCSHLFLAMQEARLCKINILFLVCLFVLTLQLLNRKREQSGCRTICACFANNVVERFKNVALPSRLYLERKCHI